MFDYHINRAMSKKFVVNLNICNLAINNDNYDDWENSRQKRLWLGQICDLKAELQWTKTDWRNITHVCKLEENPGTYTYWSTRQPISIKYTLNNSKTNKSPISGRVMPSNTPIITWRRIVLQSEILLLV